jgi:hypothetical protein
VLHSIQALLQSGKPEPHQLSTVWKIFLICRHLSDFDPVVVKAMNGVPKAFQRWCAVRLGNIRPSDVIEGREAASKIAKSWTYVGYLGGNERGGGDDLRELLSLCDQQVVRFWGVRRNCLDDSGQQWRKTVSSCLSGGSEAEHESYEEAFPFTLT